MPKRERDVDVAREMKQAEGSPRLGERSERKGGLQGADKSTTTEPALDEERVREGAGPTRHGEKQ